MSGAHDRQAHTALRGDESIYLVLTLTSVCGLGLAVPTYWAFVLSVKVFKGHT